MLPDHPKPSTRVTHSMFCPQRGKGSSRVNSLVPESNGIPATVGTDVKYVIDDMLNDRIDTSS